MAEVKKAFNLLGNLIFILVILFMVVAAFYGVKSKLDGGAPQIAGYKLYLVLSGSMNPIFDAGSVIAVKDTEGRQAKIGDIITFKDPGDANRTITHRVHSIFHINGQTAYITKGDANNAVDAKAVPAANVIGRADYWVPYAGFVLQFATTKKGLLLLFVIPGLFLIIAEIRNLLRYAAEYETEKAQQKSKNELAENQNA